MAGGRGGLRTQETPRPARAYAQGSQSGARSATIEAVKPDAVVAQQLPTEKPAKNGTLKAEDYGVGSVSGARIQDNNVTSLDLADGAVFGNDIRDGSLEDQDVGQGTFVNFQATVGTIAARDCNETEISGIDARGDHLLLTPNFDTTTGWVIYSMEWQVGGTTARLQACNPTDFAAPEGTVQMNLLVFDAQ